MTTRFNDTRQIREIIHELLQSELRPLLREILDELRVDTSAQGINPGRMYSRKEAASLIGVSIQTLVKLIETGALQCVRVRRRVLIPEVALLGMLTRKEVIAM